MDRSPTFQHSPTPTDEDDRRSRFHGGTTENGALPSHHHHHHHRERAASQPPRTSSSAVDAPAFASPPTQHFLPSSLGGWSNASGGSSASASASASSRMLSPPTNRGQPLPIRSSSFSSHPQSQFSSTMRDRAFPSTFEDDESEALSDTYDERYIPPLLASASGNGNNARGRSYGQDLSRSRSQSLAAAGRPGPVGSPYTGSAWNESYLSGGANSNPLNIPSSSSRYGDIKPPGGPSRYGSLGASLGRSPTNLHSSSPSSSLAVGNGYSSSRHTQDISNMSPFVRDVGQILLDDGSAFRELWAGMNPPRDENGGGGSGTTSRRHSVSVVQPRRGNVVGFNAPAANDLGDEPPRPSYQPPYSSRGSGLLLSDDDLASDLGMLNINPNEPHHHHHHQGGQQHQGLPPSQPSSLPIYAPLSRSPPSRDMLSTYQTINIISGAGNSSGYSRQAIGTPSEGDFSAGGSNDSPRIGTGGGGLYEEHFSPQGGNVGAGQFGGKQQDMTARYIPGQGIQYSHSHSQQQQAQQHFQQQQQQQQYVRNRATSYSSTGSLQSPLSPSTSGSGGLGTRQAVNPQQGPYFPQMQQQARRLSDAHQHHPQTPTSATSPHGHFGPPGQPQSPTSSGPGGGGGPSLNDLGKGVPLHSVPSSWPLFIVEFKAGRTDLFYLPDLSLDVRVGDLVIVEADRGKDLGKVVNDTITLGEVEAWQRQHQSQQGGMGQGGMGGMGGQGQGQGYGEGDGLTTPVSPGGGSAAQGGPGQGGPGGGKKEIAPKMIYGKAGQRDLQLLASKQEDEAKALALCQTKVRAKKLPMEVIDAEYQWDRRKLTFYFVAEKRIDFRELVRELFRLYKTRIWMASLPGGGGFEQ